MQNKKKNKKWLILAASALLSCLMLSMAVFAGYLFLRTPLNEPVNIAHQTATTATAPVVAASAAATQTPDPAVKAQQGACGSTGTMAILFTGSDTTGGVEPRGADAVRLVKVDFDKQKMMVVAFPRDLWVSTPSLGQLKIDQTRLGLAYYSKKEATNGSEKHRITAATTLLAQTLYDNFGAEPEHYLTLEMNDVAEMITAIGGVEVNIPESFISDYKISFAAGPQTLDGPRAYEFVRTYNPGGDAARLQRQNLFIKGLQARVLNAGIITKLPDLIKQFDKVLFTDLSPQQLASLGCMAKAVPQEQISFYEIGGDLVRPDGKGALIPDVEKIKAKLQEWLAD